MNRAWAIGVASVGLLLVGVTCGCIRYGNRPSEWPAFGLILLGPYLLTAIGYWFSPSRIDRFLGAVVVVTGAVLTGFVANEMWPTLFSGEPAPAILSSVFVGIMILMVQYPVGLGAALSGLTARRTEHQAQRDAEAL